LCCASVNPLTSQFRCVRFFLHMKQTSDAPPSGEELLRILAALANPHRMRILATLWANGRNYISQLAREIGISRPLLHLHLNKLEEAGLVRSEMKLSEDGKALNYFEVTPFEVLLHPHVIEQAAQSLPPENRKEDV